MGLIVQTFITSIGKKSVMAVTGVLLVLFAVLHAAGNASSFLGRDVFLSYAEHLHKLGFLLLILEFFLLITFLLHIATGVTLAVQNLLARPTRYAIKKNSGGRTFASMTMIFTGAAILFFLPVHLKNFHFRNDLISTADLIRDLFQNPIVSVFYIASVLCLAIHVSHGFWSLFQSIGLDHPKYQPLAKSGALLFSILLGGIFTLIPLMAFWHAGFLL